MSYIRYFLSLFFAVITVYSVWFIYLYLSGEIYFKPNDYTWIKGKVEEVVFISSPYQTEIDKCESDIVIKLQEGSSYFNIGSDGNTNPCYNTIKHPAFGENKDPNEEVNAVALQIRKWQAKKISEGKVVLPNIYVRGFKIDDDVVFTIEDLNQTIKTYLWIKILAASIFLIIGVGGLYLTFLAIFK